ncbi:YceI family protein [Leptospira langatensis]|uniref:YceI family protein n=1 Tax=Leptospira langatensis TaxID=2484983 RepID=UPI0014385BCF|nr:YceI family protein [Leptospira langatensis]
MNKSFYLFPIGSRSVLLCSVILLFSGPILAAPLEFPGTKQRIIQGKTIFRSVAPQEEIYGRGDNVSGEVDPVSKSVHVRIDLGDLSTGNRLRDSHMHDNYLETTLFPFASFTGKIDSYDPASGKTKLSGSLVLHGQTKENFIIEGTLSSEGNSLRFVSSFAIFLKDFHIEIPSLLILKLNEKIEIKTDFLLETIK